MRFFLCFIIFNFCLKIYSQNQYYVEDTSNFDFIINIDTTDSIIEGYTRKNALIDYGSKIQYQFVKLFSPLKYPEIIHFKGTIKDGYFKGNYYQLFKTFKMKGNIEKDSIIINLYDSKKGFVKTLRGYSINKDFKFNSYKNTIAEIINKTEDNIFNKHLLKKRKWKKFKEKIIKNSTKIQDDLEMQIGFFLLTRKFDFSHYYLVKASQTENKAKISFSQINDSVVVLDIDAFEGNRIRIDTLLKTIDSINPRFLIIDLRNNLGGNINTAKPLGDYISHKRVITNFSPNKNWYENHKNLPHKKDTIHFNLFDKANQKEYYKKAINGNGLYMTSNPTKKKFKGKIFILVNKKTGSTAEAIAQIAKENKLATIIGEKTSGALLTANKFNINNKFYLIIPINDFISYNGYRVDKKGVKPNIKTKGNALYFVLNNLLH